MARRRFSLVTALLTTVTCAATVLVTQPAGADAQGQVPAPAGRGGGGGPPPRGGRRGGGGGGPRSGARGEPPLPVPW
ncbi:hypothetical protein AAHZ94_10080 [Streptomyces sp. HSW2009]|uniref:hypothetical protein n=1 Tax=Streptomyces sp. HSW2009 TaxID=3142890 RepID=UPI0032EB0E74